MAVNVKLDATEKTQQGKPFPKLMKGPDQLIVFFHEYAKGTVIQDPINPQWEQGRYHHDWKMSEFTDYNEPITIQNA